MLIRNIQKFAISKESVRIKVVKIFSEKYPEVLVEKIHNFAISDESMRIELAQILLRKQLSTSLIDDGYFEKLQIPNPSARCNLYASAYLALIAKGDMRATDKTWINQFFPRDPEPMSLAQVAAQFGNRHPVIADLLEEAEQQSDPQIREILSTWTHLVSLRFAADQLPEAAWQELKAPLQAIQKWRAPATRYVLTHLLAQQCLPPEAKDANGFFTFCKKFTKPHTRLYSTLLFPLFQSAPDDPIWGELVTRLHRPDFKDVKRQKAMINALLALVQADGLPVGLKCSLLQAALSNGSGDEAAPSLADTTRAIECLVSLAQSSTELENAVLPRLKSIRNRGDFKTQMNEVFKDLFPDLSNAQNAVTQFSDYRGHLRYPNGVLSYAAKMQNGLYGDEKALVMAAISQFVNATVLSPDREEQAFKQLRYDTTKSDHLRRLADKAPDAFAQWQQPCIYEPSATFLAKTSDSTKQTDIAAYLLQRVVMDQHVPLGTYSLLEQVLTGQCTLVTALQESEEQEASVTVSRQVEASLLQLLDEHALVEQKASLLKDLLTFVPPGQFHQDLTHLTNLLTASSRQDAKQFEVIDTDAADDLFLCGTEVAGSCQNIQGESYLNKALMGYVLDGKYRMLAIKSADGYLTGRRMLRLLWNEQVQQPVLHLERFYHNPGIPEKYEQALVELALQKARQMGCVLVSHDKTSHDYYPPLLTAYPTPWPFEYVDAEELRVRTGKDGYQLSVTRVVASPH